MVICKRKPLFYSQINTKFMNFTPGTCIFSAPVFPRDEPTIRDFTPSAIMMSWQPAVIPEGMTLPVTTPVFYSVESQSPPGMGAWSTLYARHPAPSVKLSDLRPDLDYLVRVRAHYDDFISEPTLPVYIPRRAGLLNIFILALQY